MSDEADLAQRPEQLFREEALANREPIGRPGWKSLTHCIDCGDPIPEKRRLAIEGCLRCYDCQVEFYKENGR